MIKLIGTNHLMSKEEIYNILEKEKPSIIAVELCQTRFNLMVLPIINNTQIPIVQNDDGIIAKISNKIKEKAAEKNIQYGSDMINASIYAKEKGIQLEFIDRDIMETKEDMEKIPPSELNFFLQELSRLELSDLTKSVNEDEVLKALKNKTPISFRILITMRDFFIANSLLRLDKRFPEKKIVAILGKGHIKAMENLL